LMSRVERRGICYERAIDAPYLARLSDAYVRHFHHYDKAPVLFVNTEGLNFVDEPQHLKLLFDHIEAMRGARAFFSVTA
jgi:deoxyguanosine kinase